MTMTLAMPDRSSRWLLVGSLALNLFFIGTVLSLAARPYVMPWQPATTERPRTAAARVERLRARPPLALEREGQRLERTRERLRQAPALAVERKRAALENSAAKLAALSPVQTLERGYAIVRTDSGDVVTSTSDISVAAHVDVTLADGGFGARVEDVEP